MLPLLRGIQVVEIGSVVMGPLAAQILADLGAEVVKVEPLEGDVARASHPRGEGGGALFVNNNRNKRGIAVDLKSAEGREILQRLIARSDVVLHNLRPEAAARLGVDFDSVAAMNARVIHCAAVGYGHRGREGNRPAFDDTIQGASGMAGLVERVEGTPRFVPTILADKVTALHVAYGILAALVSRARGSTGPLRIEVPMFETTVAFLMNEHLAGATFATDGRTGYDRVLDANRRPFRTTDGWVAVLPYTAQQWERFLREAGRDDLVAEAWFGDARTRQAHIHVLYAALADALATRDTATWLATCTRLDIPASPVHRIEELLDDPHLGDVGFFDTGPLYPPGIVRMVPQPVQFHGVSSSPDRPPPALGADTIAVLEECGFARSEVDAFVAHGVVKVAGAS